MYVFSQTQRWHALCWLAFFHILIIASSNYLVQIPFLLWGFHTTWGAITFPFIFLTTDLTVRIFGASLARKIIFAVMIPALLLSYAISVTFFNGTWMGFSALSEFNVFVGRIAFASFAAYVFGQALDITVFNYLRVNHRWWVAPSASAVLGNAVDTLIFFSIAFYQTSDPFMAKHWVEISLLDYAFKILICAIFFLPLYGVLLRFLLRKLTSMAEKIAPPPIALNPS